MFTNTHAFITGIPPQYESYAKDVASITSIPNLYFINNAVYEGYTLQQKEISDFVTLGNSFDVTVDADLDSSAFEPILSEPVRNQYPALSQPPVNSALADGVGDEDSDLVLYSDIYENIREYYFQYANTPLSGSTLEYLENNTKNLIFNRETISTWVSNGIEAFKDLIPYYNKIQLPYGLNGFEAPLAGDPSKSPMTYFLIQAKAYDLLLKEIKDQFGYNENILPRVEHSMEMVYDGLGHTGSLDEITSVTNTSYPYINVLEMLRRYSNSGIPTQPMGASACYFVRSSDRIYAGSTGHSGQFKVC